MKAKVNQMKTKLAFFLAAALTVFFVLPACAAAIPSRPLNGFVADEAQVLTKETVETLDEQGAETVRNTGTDVVVVTVDYTGTSSIDGYADQVFSRWEIEDGLVLVLSIGDEDYYAMPSAGLGRYLSSSGIQDILDEFLEPDFAVGDYDEGVKKAYQAFCEEIGRLYGLYGEKPGGTGDEAQGGYESHPASGPREERHSSGFGMFAILFVVVLFVIVVSSVSRVRYRPYRRPFFGPVIFRPRGSRMPPPSVGRPFGPGPTPPRKENRPESWGSRGFGGGGSRGGGAGRSAFGSSRSGRRSGSFGSRGGGFGGGGSRGGGAGRGRR